MTLRACTEQDFEAILEIINDGARAYQGVIPDDCWHDPYMTREDLKHEIADGIAFWGVEHHGLLLGVMGVQDRGDVTLIRHAYVRTTSRRQGIGTVLLHHLQHLTEKPILIGTWADAHWATSFYSKHGYTLLGKEEKDGLLRKYWSIPDRQAETSVVLANQKWTASARTR